MKKYKSYISLQPRLCITSMRPMVSHNNTIGKTLYTSFNIA